MEEIFLKRSREILIKNNIGIGIKAGNYYPDLWCRDALISSLGMIRDNQLLDLARKSIEIISKYQKFTGQLPNKISPDEKKICFGEGGCVDSSLWYPIVVLDYYRVTKDLKFLKNHYTKVNKAISWALCLDQNNDWLIETNEGSDWCDVLLHSGRVLYNNVLLYKALKDADEINSILGKEIKYEFIAENLKETINLFFWPTKNNINKIEELYNYSGISEDIKIILQNMEEINYYITDIGFRKYNPRFDSFANLLTILFDIANEEQKDKIFKYIENEKIYEPYPLKVLHPPVSRSDPFWCFYFRPTNLPYLQEPGNYHNGGIWPFIGGFYIVALKKEGKYWKDKFNKLVACCEQENWSFPEWLTSDGKVAGSLNQSWSAAMLLYAWYY